MIRLSTTLVVLTALVIAWPANGAVPFETATAIYENAARERVWDGRVEAVNQATVSAQTSGRIAELPFDVNDFVDAGDVVMRFTDTEQKAALSRAEASSQEARARLAEASQAFERFSKMIENNSVSQSQLDQSRANRDAAQARLNAARSGVETAQEQLEYTVVRAPYAGIVSKRHVELGELVSPGQPLISGLSLQQLRVNIDVPQSMFHSVRTIGKAFAYVDGKRILRKVLRSFPSPMQRPTRFACA